MDLQSILDMQELLNLIKTNFPDLWRISQQNVTAETVVNWYGATFCFLVCVVFGFFAWKIHVNYKGRSLPDNTKKLFEALETGFIAMAFPMLLFFVIFSIQGFKITASRDYYAIQYTMDVVKYSEAEPYDAEQQMSYISKIISDDDNTGLFLYSKQDVNADILSRFSLAFILMLTCALTVNIIIRINKKLNDSNNSKNTVEFLSALRMLIPGITWMAFIMSFLPVALNLIRLMMATEYYAIFKALDVLMK